MKRMYLLFIIIFGFAQVGFGQTDIWTHNFETTGGYLTSVIEFTDSSGDYFKRTDGTDIAGNVVYTNPQGSFYFGAQDIDGEGAILPVTLIFDDVDISTFSDLIFYVYLAEDDDGANQDWDATDYLHIQYDIDNSGTFLNLIWIESAISSNGEPLIDTDFDGTGDGLAITSAFTEFTNAITGTGNLIDIKVTFSLNSEDEDIALDNFRLSGTPAGTPVISVSTTTLTGFEYVETAGPSVEQTFTVSASYLSNNITLTPPSNYEISTVTAPFVATSPITLVPIVGTVSETTIYTRLKAGLTAGDYNSENIYVTSTGASSKTVTNSGTVAVLPIVPDLIITEIMQNPNAVGDSDGEWFEIYNNEDSVIDIDGYTIKDAGTNSHVIDNGGTLTIPTKGFIVLGINSNAATNGGLTVHYQYADITLANVDDEIILLYTDGSTIVDEVYYDGGPNFPDPTGASMILTNLTADNNVGSNWATSTIREGSWIATSGDYGSPGDIGSETALPVELTSFTATSTSSVTVVLNWTTATEINNYGFEIQRAWTSLATDWETVGFVEGHGNSNSPKEYSYVVSNATSGSYRLKQIDTDGAFEYSEVVTVSGILSKTELFQNHPNPFNPSTQISFSLATASQVNVSIYNTLGQKVAELVNGNMNVGTHIVEFNASILSSGFYFYRLETANYSKTMKMLLIK